MFNYAKAIAFFFSGIGISIGLIITLFLVIYVTYMSIIVLTIAAAIYLIKLSLDGKG